MVTHPFHRFVYLGVIVCSACVAVFTAVQSWGSGSAWKGYIAIAAPISDSDAEIHAALESRGFKSPLTGADANVVINDFGQYEAIPLAQFQDKVDGLDPRDDGYASKLASLFVNGSRRYAYVENRNVPLFPTLALAPLEGYSPVVSGASMRDRSLCAMAFCIGLLLFFRIAQRAKPQKRLWGLFPFFALATMGPGTTAAVGLTLAGLESLGISLRERYSLRNRRAIPVTELSLVCAGISFVVWAGASPLLLVLGLLSWIAAFAFEDSRSKNIRLGHRRFIPVSIMDRSPLRSASDTLWAAAPFALSSALIALFFAFAPTSFPVGSDSLPLPLSSASATALGAVPLISSLDYDVHASRQAAFFSNPLNGRSDGCLEGYAIGPSGLPEAQDLSDEPIQMDPFPLQPVDKLIQRQQDAVFIAPDASVQSSLATRGLWSLVASFTLILVGSLLRLRVKRSDRTLELAFQKRVAA